ncbi:MAG: FMN-binding glutamate synthase family protein [Gemmatimonadota bacterium]|nr:MAG: FMN-binding glutamate synthase family protein [Gemmatimonadota bacterium]
MTVLIILGALVVLVVIYDVMQKRHAILRNYPIIGHFRYWLETIGPELRQYIVAANNEERPFSRDQRRWVYSSAKKENNYFGFGTDNEMELTSNYVIIKHSVMGAGGTVGHADENPDYPVPCAKVMGGPRGRAKAFRPASVVNISAMSFGSLSAAAVEAINRGCAIAGCLQNTGEGGISPYHGHGGELIWQLGTAYFGARSPEGAFSLERFLDAVEANPVRAIEIKLSQGAKPGLGGVLPGAKVTSQIAAIRGVPVGKDVHSPSGHAEFGDPDEMLDFVEMLAEETGLPIGIKSAVGQHRFWEELANLMSDGRRGVDFITIDGGEGGTGAAPLSFADHVALPFKMAFGRVYGIFAETGVHERVVFIGSGKLGFPSSGLMAFALGCDMINVAREAMMAVGCIQAQRCHTGHCPTGVATQNRWLMRGLDPTSKAVRLANYVVTLRKELLQLSRACGVIHPGLLSSDHIEILNDHFGSSSVAELFGYRPEWGFPSPADRRDIERIMADAQ